MSILSPTSSPVASKSSHRGRPVQPARRTVKPAAPFAAGLEEPIASKLPTINGFDLNSEENRRVNGCRNRAMAAYAGLDLMATSQEIDRVGRLAATDELQRVLRERPIATAPTAVIAPPAAPAAPQPGPRPTPTPRPVVRPRRSEPTQADQTWWSQYVDRLYAGPAPICGGSPEADLLPSGSYGSLEDWLTNGDPTPAELSDDHNGAFGTGGGDPC